MRARAIAAAAVALSVLLSTTPGVAQVAGDDPETYKVTILSTTAAIEHGPEIAHVLPSPTDCVIEWDECRVAVPLPFAYTFYGKTYSAGTDVWINLNGILEFEKNSVFPFPIGGLPLPRADLHDVILANWEDLVIHPDRGQGLRTSLSGEAPNRVFNIEWRGEYFLGTGDVEANFELRLYEGQSRFDIIYAKPGDAGERATVGAQSGTNGPYNLYSYKQPVLAEGLALQFDRLRPTTLTADAAVGTYGGTTDVTARLIDARGPVADATVGFEIDGVFVGAAVSDGNGNATITGVPLGNRGAGRHDNVVHARFAGTPTHLASEAHASLVVERATPVLTWESPAPIVYGTALGAAQLNAAANVPGTFAYSRLAGEVLRADTHEITVEFRPEDGGNYNTVTMEKSLMVTRAELLIGVDDKSRLLGAPNPEFTGSITGIRNGDPIAVRYHTTATTTSPVGTYAIEATLDDPQQRLPNYNVTVSNGDLTVSYKICALYDQTRAHRRGRTVPIKLQLCTASGSNVSKYGTVLNALAVTLTATQTTGAPEDAGDANPDGNFRYTWFDSGSGYIFNLKTTELEQAGIYRLTFNVSGDSATHSVQFQLR